MLKYSSAKSPRPLCLETFVLFVISLSLCYAENSTNETDPEFQCNLPTDIETTICSWTSEKPADMKINEASRSFIARVLNITNDITKTRKQNSPIFDVDLEVLCILKGEPVPSRVLLTEGGQLLGRCFHFMVDVGKTYVINAYENNGYLCPHDDALEYDRHKDTVSSMCHLSYTYPEGLTGQTSFCPTKKASCTKQEDQSEERAEQKAPDEKVTAKVNSSDALKLTPKYILIVFVFIIFKFLVSDEK